VIVYSNTRCFRAAPGLSFFEHIFARTIGLDNLVQRLFYWLLVPSQGLASFSVLKLSRNHNDMSWLLELSLNCKGPRRPSPPTLAIKLRWNPSDASTCEAKQARMWCIGRDQIVSPQQLPLTESSSWRIINLLSSRPSGYFERKPRKAD
jgi:hypothetical protein